MKQINEDIEIKFKNFIDKNLDYYLNLGNSEVEVYDVDDMNDVDEEMIEWLEENYRFDYKGICMYSVVEDNEIWVENMNS